MIPWGEPFVLVGSDDEVREASFRLKRIGYDAPAGFLQGGLDAWTQASLPVGSLKLVQAKDLHQQMQAGTAPVIVDVRLPTEWMASAHRRRAQYSGQQAVHRQQAPRQGYAGSDGV